MAPWWIDERIDATVTRAFIAKHLAQEEYHRLDRPVAFRGPELAVSATYWDVIRGRAKRLFLILLDVCVPEQIFGIVDDGWDDSKLPLAQKDVERLQLTGRRNDSSTNRKFYQRQFFYLLKSLRQGDHHHYAVDEIVPLDVVDKFSGLKDMQSHSDKVKIPNEPDRVFIRRRFRLKGSTAAMSAQDFRDCVAGIRAVQNEHIVSYWASYVHDGTGYVLVTPTTDINLKSFLSGKPASFKNLEKPERRRLIIDWIMCLVDTVAYLHSQNRSHCHIKPSTILFDQHNQIFIADSSRLNPDSAIARGDKLSFDREGYDYAAPEQWYRPSSSGHSSHSPPAAMDFYVDVSNHRISRGFDRSGFQDGAAQNMHPSLNPQHADIFSLGCIILELLTYLVKRSTSKFAASRSAKHKTAGRGGAVLDASFHRNLGQVEAWMSGLAREAAKMAENEEDGAIYHGVIPLLHVATSMLATHPFERPSAKEIKDQVYNIITQHCGITEPHCVHAYSSSRSPFNLHAAMGQMRISGNVGGGGGGDASQYSPPIHFSPPVRYPHSATTDYSTWHSNEDRRPSSSLDDFSPYSETDSSIGFSSRSSERESEIGVAVSSRGHNDTRWRQQSSGGSHHWQHHHVSPGRGTSHPAWQSLYANNHGTYVVD